MTLPSSEDPLNYAASVLGWRGAFSTLGCAGLPLAEVARLARAHGFLGVELRSADGEPVHRGLTPRERREAARILADGGVEPLAIASYVEVDDPAVADADVVAATAAELELALDLGAAFVRVFPGGPSTDDAAARRLSAVAEQLDSLPGVTVAVETHDSCSRGEDLAHLLGRIGHPHVRAVWDVQHPWRAGEPVEETARLLLPFAAYVQITDARSLDDPTPCPLGTGVLPLREARAALERSGYEGWVSLEWASYWYPEAPPLSVGLEGAAGWLDGTLWDDPP
jgi:sugar phosphate isomerase/epimerase